MESVRWLHWLTWLRGSNSPSLAKLENEYQTRCTKATPSLTRFDPNLCNPLCKSTTNPWHDAHKDHDLKDEIWRDVTRTFQERDFFQQDRNQRILQRAIFSWCKSSNMGYKQGINEIAAVVFHAISEEQPEWTAETAEAVLFAILDGILLIPEVRGMFFNPIGPEGVNFTTKTCSHIFDGILKKERWELHRHLATVVEVSPNLFLLRWRRLLFTREFHIDDVLKIWDFLISDFAETGKFELADFFCVAMLDFISNELKKLDNSGCLQRLLKYPPVADITVICSRAVALREGRPIFRRDSTDALTTKDSRESSSFASAASTAGSMSGVLGLNIGAALSAVGQLTSAALTSAGLPILPGSQPPMIPYVFPKEVVKQKLPNDVWGPTATEVSEWSRGLAEVIEELSVTLPPQQMEKLQKILGSMQGRF